MTNLPINLIVNADDYGYYPCVSRGIRQAVTQGRVTATGIIANAPNLNEQIERLAGHKDLDVGIHLNLTSRRPLSFKMEEKLNQWEGQFPSAYAMAGEILSGRIGLDRVFMEWSAQVETLLGLGLQLQFINSHEHIHMLPSLYKLAMELADEYQIPHIRLTRAEWMSPLSFASLLRNTPLQMMEWMNVKSKLANTPHFIGLNCSGKLNLTYLKKRLSSLKPGLSYELMCHPGQFDPVEITDSRLLAYHAWESELKLLTSDEFITLLDDYNIRLVNYRAL